MERKTCSSLCEVMLVVRREVPDAHVLEVHKVIYFSLNQNR